MASRGRAPSVRKELLPIRKENKESREEMGEHRRGPATEHGAHQLEPQGGAPPPGQGKREPTIPRAAEDGAPASSSGATGTDGRGREGSALGGDPRSGAVHGGHTHRREPRDDKPRRVPQ